MFAIQLAKGAGAHVTGVASFVSPNELEIVGEQLRDIALLRLDATFGAAL